MASSTTPPSTLVRLVQLASYGFVMVTLAIVAWHARNLDLPDVGQFAGIIGSGLLGGVLNPVKTAVTAAGPAGSPAAEGQAGAADAAVVAVKHDVLWILAVLVAAGSLVGGALALAAHPEQHPNAAPALTALATAFAALFLDTSGITHAIGTVTGVAKDV
jgi:hypothetical protein